jgi:hypothetical protein
VIELLKAVWPYCCGALMLLALLILWGMFCIGRRWDKSTGSLEGQQGNDGDD